MIIKKTLLLLSVIAIISTLNVYAQRTHDDSTEVINAAHRYARGFRLRDKDLQKFHRDHFPATSDYFKPDVRRMPKVLLADSLFVTTFRLVAFDNVLSEKSFHPLLPPSPPLRDSRGAGFSDPVKDIARKDAQRFNLSNAILARFRIKHFPPTSDYFKPATRDASDPAMLDDSVYVKAFRLGAYNKAVNQRVNP